MESKLENKIIIVCSVIIVILIGLITFKLLSSKNNDSNTENNINNINDSYSKWIDYLLKKDIQEITINRVRSISLGDNEDYNKTVTLTRTELKNIFKEISKYTLKKQYVRDTGGTIKDSIKISYLIDNSNYTFEIFNGSVITVDGLDKELLEMLNNSELIVENEELKDYDDSYYVFIFDKNISFLFDEYFENGDKDNYISSIDFRINDLWIQKTSPKTITFYKDEVEIGSYECSSSSCGICQDYNMCSGVSLFYNTIYEKGKLFLYDFNNELESNNYDTLDKLILWDINDNKIVVSYNDITDSYKLYTSKPSSNGRTHQYSIIKNKNNETAIIDLNGNYIKNYSSKEYVIVDYEGTYIEQNSYIVEQDMIVTKKDNKYGIESISEDKIIINHNYDEIILYDEYTVRKDDYLSTPLVELYSNKYFKAKIDNKWSLYNINTGNKVIDKEYDKIYLLDENTIAIYDNGYLAFIDYNGNEISDKIQISNLYSTMPDNPEGIIFRINDNIVKISILDGSSNENIQNYSYEYNLETKDLKQIN